MRNKQQVVNLGCFEFCIKAGLHLCLVYKNCLVNNLKNVPISVKSCAQSSKKEYH